MVKKHKHLFFLKNAGSFSLPKFYRQCDCGKKAKLTKYKISL